MQTEKQRERLVELITEFEKNEIVRCPKYDDPTCDGCEYDLGTECDKTSILSDYLMSKNVVVLRCKVGDTVYSFSSVFGVVLPYLVGTLNIVYMGKSGVYYIYEANCSDPETDELLDDIDFESEDIGKTVFLSREEAESVLKERNNEN